MTSSGIDHAHNLTRKQVIDLLEERDILRETVAQLEEKLREMLAPQSVMLPRSWRLTRKEELVVLAFLKVGTNTLDRERLMLTLYGMFDDDTPQVKICDVFICKIRRKMMEAQTLIHIETVWGRGWRLEPESLNRLKGVVEAQRASIWEPGQALKADGRSARAA